MSPSTIPPSTLPSMVLNTPCPPLAPLSINFVESDMPSCLHVSASQLSALHTLLWSMQPNLGMPSLFHHVIFFRSAPPLSPICPQPNQRSLEEELIGLPDIDIPRQVLAQDEFDCLNLNITAPAHQSSLSRLPVMIWVHGLVLSSPRVSSNSLLQGVETTGVAPAGFTTAAHLSPRAFA